MEEQQQSPFRQRALEYIATPKALDDLIQIIPPLAWLPLLGIWLILAAILGWVFLGSISTTVTGKGVVISPDHAVVYISGQKSQPLKVGMKVHFSPLAYSKQNQFKDISGKITAIEYFPVTSSGPATVIDVALTPHQQQDFLLPGMLSKAQIIIRRESPYSLMIDK